MSWGTDDGKTQFMIALESSAEKRVLIDSIKGVYGRMIALRRRIYADVPLSIITTGQKRGGVRKLYDEEQYRPKVRHVKGNPMFLYYRGASEMMCE